MTMQAATYHHHSMLILHISLNLYNTKEKVAMRYTQVSTHAYSYVASYSQISHIDAVN